MLRRVRLYKQTLAILLLTVLLLIAFYLSEEKNAFGSKYDGSEVRSVVKTKVVARYKQGQDQTSDHKKFKDYFPRNVRKFNRTNNKFQFLPDVIDDEETILVRDKLIIMTYMRSGSTLTGDIIQQSQDVFYMYEPLWNIERVLTNKSGNGTLTFLNGTSLPFVYNAEFYMARKIQILESVLNCSLMELDVGTLTQYHMFNSLSTRAFGLCANHQKDMEILGRCVRVLQNDCRKSKVVVIKVIRSSMLEMYRLMTREPRLKVLHLLRDPRGTMKSQYLVGAFNWTHLPKTSLGHCQRVSRDLEMSQFVSEEFPGRIFILRYEDLVERPIRVTKQLYSFVNLTLTLEIQNYIWNITYGGNPDGCNICTVRENATETAYSWRKKMSFASIWMIQSQCWSVMNILKYRTFDSNAERMDGTLSAKY
ncbi:carbohydrate sulfotransferase 3-like isoform X2 [Biomphalaria glabrata]|nr:carbohydrate sulfotransferase 3-like isoform X2 [Biomphalaria glabrata]XP_055860559.1 carbohydrate sulfotransferase 3-like isoform X2 [Biomphalaria glabrata]XP_055860560.1 carbohydrate sulfotransferase 3-like isoform X2 [Biomphalaria glabrata]XP_055860561.1 carbohydrate sulfotransferase 3-like isoform X2 [Biomphalaria glabrata]